MNKKKQDAFVRASFYNSLMRGSSGKYEEIPDMYAILKLNRTLWKLFADKETREFIIAWLGTDGKHFDGLKDK